MTALSDAHRHLPGAPRSVVNGTSPADWDAVIALAAGDTTIRAAAGVHPWWLAGVPSDWDARLQGLLERHPALSVGETGLDLAARGIASIDAQIEALVRQLALAGALGRAATVHCVRAFDDLLVVLASVPRPARGILLHGYSGPAGLVEPLVELGCSFSYARSHAGVRERLAAFALVPDDRLLVETDAPGRGRSAADLLPAYETLAALRGLAVDDLAALATANVARLFG